jgi:hypothetical protein
MIIYVLTMNVAMPKVVEMQEHKQRQEATCDGAAFAAFVAARTRNGRGAVATNLMIPSVKQKRI